MKLENILMTSSGHLLLSDFGIARPINSRFDPTSTLGTNGYFPPEVLAPGLFNDSHSIFSEKLDVWSLGVVLLELFSRRRSPYENLLVSPGEPMPLPGFIGTFVCDPSEFTAMQLVNQTESDLYDLLLKVRHGELRGAPTRSCSHPSRCCVGIRRSERPWRM